MRVLKFSVEVFLFQTAEKFRKEQFSVSLLLGIEKMQGSERVVITIARRNFFSHSTEKIVEEPFLVPKKFWY